MRYVTFCHMSDEAVESPFQ